MKMETLMDVPANVGVTDQILALLAEEPDLRPRRWPVC
jgi:hypothetical protein